MKYLLILVLLVGCSTKKQSFAPGRSSPLLEQYIQEFEDDFNIDVNFEVVFVPYFSANLNNPNIIGMCLSNGPFKRVEIIETKEFSRSLAAIVWHEIGHCALDISHYEKTYDIMNSKLTDSIIYYFDSYRQQMIENYENGVYSK